MRGEHIRLTKVGKDEATVSKHFRRRMAPGARTLERYAEALECSVGELFS